MNPTSSRRASHDYLSSLSRILNGQLPEDFGLDADSGQQQNVFSPPKAPSIMDTIGIPRATPSSAPAAPMGGSPPLPAGFPTNYTVPPPNLAPTPIAPPQAPPMANTTPDSQRTLETLQAALQQPAGAQLSVFNPATLGPPPSALPTNSQRKGDLIGSLAAALLGSALGGSPRAGYAAQAGFGQGTQQARQQQQMDAMNAYQQQAQAEQARVQSANQQAVQNDAAANQRLQRLTSLFGIQSGQEEKQAATQERADAAAAQLAELTRLHTMQDDAKRQDQFLKASTALRDLTPDARKTQAPMIAAMFPDIADKVPGLVDSLNAAEKQADVQKAQAQKQADEQKRVQGLDKELSDILKEGNNAKLARANEILRNIHPGATPFTDLRVPLTSYQQAQLGIQQGQLDVARGRLSVEQQRQQQSGASKSDLPERRFAYEQQKDAARDVTALTKIRDTARTEEQSLNRMLQMPKGRMVQTNPTTGKTVPVPESARDALRKRRDAAYDRANDLDNQIQTRQAGGYTAPGGVAPATVIGPDGLPFQKPIAPPAGVPGMATPPGGWSPAEAAKLTPQSGTSGATPVPAVLPNGPNRVQPRTPAGQYDSHIDYTKMSAQQIGALSPAEKKIAQKQIRAAIYAHVGKGQ